MGDTELVACQTNGTRATRKSRSASSNDDRVAPLLAGLGIRESGMMQIIGNIYTVEIPIFQN